MIWRNWHVKEFARKGKSDMVQWNWQEDGADTKD
jgi:hypothetical protein